ncbi:368_t:CDS:2 [Gigaspora margarita]|uniref:368_t:CDS:1 n=1 Tax=Gigaspora margarita TaxID=4874 RepID=A0ABM8VXB9_GIGMA|nr:368_t:CDS:2 [Gigaspora margarita]
MIRRFSQIFSNNDDDLLYQARIVELLKTYKCTTNIESLNDRINFQNQN